LGYVHPSLLGFRGWLYSFVGLDTDCGVVFYDESVAVYVGGFYDGVFDFGVA